MNLGMKEAVEEPVNYLTQTREPLSPPHSILVSTHSPQVDLPHAHSSHARHRHSTSLTFMGGIIATGERGQSTT